jgi:hypothetical protein
MVDSVESVMMHRLGNPEFSGNSLPTFRDNLSDPSSRVKGPIGCPKTSERNNHFALRNGAEERSPCLWFM